MRMTFTYSYPSIRYPNKGARVLEYYMRSTHSSTAVSSGNTRTHPPDLNFAWVQKPGLKRAGSRTCDAGFATRII
eukprot:scaffold5544_cov40-Cyclotella_meneghiniana.AAC.1